MIYIKNISGSESIVRGHVLPNGVYLLIQDAAEYYNDSDIFDAISADELQVSKTDDGNNDIVDKVEQWNYLGNLVPKDVVVTNQELDSKGRPLMALVKPSGLSDGTMVTHDLCDKTTWYMESTEHTGVSLTANGLDYSHIDHTHWIDLTHGKLYGEDNVANSREPKIYDGGVEITTGFTINYSTGVVTFDSTPSGAVTADFWKAGSSQFLVAPTAGKILALEHAELQFSSDVMMSSPIRFEIWVYNPYAGVPGHPYENAGVKIPYKVIRYKNIKDIINAANLGQGYIPKISGLQHDILVFPFNYIATKPLQSSLGAELRVSIENDIELPGEWATATFYFLSEDE